MTGAVISPETLHRIATEFHQASCSGRCDWIECPKKAVSPAGVIEGSRSSGHVDAPAGGIPHLGKVRDAPVTGSGEHGDPAANNTRLPSRR